MPVSLQIFIGCLPLLIAAAVTALRKKALVLPCAMILLILAATVFGLVRYDLGSQTSATGSSAQAVTRDQLLYLAQQETAAGNYDLAKDLLDQMYQHFGDDAEGSLQMARLDVLSGDLTAALTLYQKACALNTDLSVTDTEANYFAMAESGSLLSVADAAVKQAEVEYLTAQGLDAADYGYTATSAELGENADLITAFQIYIQDISGQDAEDADYDSDSRTASEKILEAAAILDEAVSSYRSTGIFTSEDVDTMEDALDDVEEYISDAPEMAGIPYVDNAIVGGYQLTGNVEGLISYAEITGSDTGYGAIADLYVQGEVSDKLLEEDFSELTWEEYRELADECQKTADSLNYDSKQAQADIEDMIDSLLERMDNPVLSGLETSLHPEDYPIEEQSKLYLVKSMINYALGNDTKGEEYFSEALTSAPYCDDADYAEAMTAISAVLNGTADSNDIKNVSDYLTDAYCLAYPAWVEYADGEPVGYVNTSSSGENSMPEGAEYIEDGVFNSGSTDDGSYDSDYDGSYSYDSTYDTADPEEDEDDSDFALSGGIPEDFLNGVSQYATTATAMINISSVDASNFPEVTFRLQSTREISLTNPQLNLWDCNLSIGSFTITEVPYEGARVALVCDTSGSMSGSEGSLQEAVQKYIDDMNDDEQVSIVAFADGVKFTSGFSGDESYFSDYISRLNASGGTNISSGVWSAIESMQTSENVYRAIIVLTDGEDSSFSSDSLASLNATCEEYGITVYTIGLGSSIQAEYLESIAAAGNGQFVYCSDITQLESLYAFIHSQMQNSYDITYTAINTEWSERTVAVENTEDGGYAEKEYTIDVTELQEDGAKITSIDNHSIYKKEASVTFHLLGEDFAEDTNFSVTISGDMGRYVLETTYLSDTQVTVTIPGDVPVGTYTLTATADQSVYEDEIELFSEYQELTFGAYTFRAQKISVSGTEAVMTGDVTLNDYLHFYGTVTLLGNVESDLSVTLVDDSGSYVTGTDQLSGIFASIYDGTVYMSAFGNVTIFNDQAHLNDLNEYKVEAFNCGTFSNVGLIMESGTASLYPHMISYLAMEINFSLPLQTDLMKYAELDTPFTAEANLTVLVVPAGLRAAGKISAEVERDFDFLTLPLYFKKFELEFDTFNQDYSLEIAVSTNALVPTIGKKKADDADYGFSIEIDGGYFDSFHLKADAKIVLSEAPMLVTLSDFQFGLSGLADASQSSGQDTSFGKMLLAAEWEGGCDISLWKLKDVVPAAEAIFKDKSLFSLDDTTLSVRLSNIKVELNTTAKLLGFEVGSAEGTLGNYSYSNYLLGISEEDTTGICLSLTAGPKVEFGNLEFSAQGELELALSSIYSGAWLNGTVDYDITFIKHFSNTVDGNLVLAVHNNNTQVTLLIKGENLKKNKETGFKLTLSSGWPSLKFY